METAVFGDISKKSTRLDSLSKEEMIQKYTVLESELARVVRELYRLRNQKISDEQLQLIMQGQLESLRDTVFGKSSERYKKPVKDGGENEPKDPPKPRIRKPSERYPHIPVREQLITMSPAPHCSCCGNVMTGVTPKKWTRNLCG